MYDIIGKLLILQDRDQRILLVREQLARLGPERETLRSQTSALLDALDAAKARGKQIESDRKQLELEVDAKKKQIARYSLQQFQTKKNEEYRALAHEIQTCNDDIVKLEDAQLDLMEQAEATQREILAVSRQAEDLKRLADGQIQELLAREQSLTAELAGLESHREQLKSAVEDRALQRYERLLKMKGATVVAGIQHGVCGGCHMKFPVQLVVTCQAGRELVTCPNCGRILYHTSDMDLTPID
ncbi:MAG: C4-type zinc ribbon domain-containing protein [Verrucomicrobiota bacterium]|jgi:predicted  nucleic acid-binding Zn-ribbon protein